MKKLILCLVISVLLSLAACGMGETAQDPSETAGAPTASDVPIIQTTAPQKETISVKIGENLRADDIAALLEGAGLGSAEKYCELFNSGDFEFGFVKKLKLSELPENRKYLLEGYMLPGEYEFEKGSDEKAVLNRILSAFDSLWTEELFQKADKLGYTMDEIITIASIVEVETADNADCPATASVFLNRLASPDFPKLQSDRTVLYVLDGFGRTATNDDVRIDSPYNTYIYKGLPPSAICSPSTEAILGTLGADNTDYYYFINCHNGRNAYATDLAEHKANYQKYLAGEL